MDEAGYDFGTVTTNGREALDKATGATARRSDGDQGNQRDGADSSFRAPRRTLTSRTAP